MPTVDELLLRCAGPVGDPAALPHALRALGEKLGFPLAAVRSHAALGGGELYAYFALAGPLPLDAEMSSCLQQAAKELQPLACLRSQVTRLQRIADIPGASHGQLARFHYAVETDPAPGWEEELERWYRDEHLPGLASVHGTVRARRFRNLDSGPLSLACYDLLSPETLQDEAWLAVRHTPWSARVRPNFRHTKRTMFRTLLPDTA